MCSKHMHAILSIGMSQICHTTDTINYPMEHLNGSWHPKNRLCMFSKHIQLVEAEKERMNHIQLELENIYKMKQIKIKQRSRDKNIKEGDNNTSYFQVVVIFENRGSSSDEMSTWSLDFQRIFSSKLAIHLLCFIILTNTITHVNVYVHRITYLTY